ncbi:MAG: 50S ribosomal protein L24 [Candidatus Thermoplasmatota archaeon]
MTSKKPRKQRKKHFNKPLHKKRKHIASHLEESLLLKYNRRAVPVIEGDTVKVLRGSFKGHEDKVVGVDVRKGKIQIEGLTLIKTDGNRIPKPIDPSNVLITKLNLTDKWRREYLERAVPEETREEIEKEAEEQIKVREEEKRRAEEEKKKAEEEEEEEEEEEATAGETKKTEEKKESEEPEEEKVEEKTAEDKKEERETKKLETKDKTDKKETKKEDKETHNKNKSSNANEKEEKDK